MNKKDERTSTEDRIELIQGFKELLQRWFDEKYEPEGEGALRVAINRRMKAAEAAVEEVGCLDLMTARLPPALGGRGIDLNPFSVIFEDPYGLSVIPDLVDMLDQAIGRLERDLGIE